MNVLKKDGFLVFVGMTRWRILAPIRHGKNAERKSMFGDFN